MYQIIKTDGTTLGATDSLYYIKVSDVGCYTPCAQEEAVGVAYQSVAYNLFGHDEIDGDTVIVREIDGGASLTEQQAALDSMILTILEG